MIESFLSLLELHLLPLGALGVFAATVIEEVIAPIPSAFVLLGAGFLFAGDGVLPFGELALTIAVPAALGMTIGSLFVYGIAYYFGKLALVRCGKWLGVSWQDVETGRERFSRGPRDEITLFTIRAVPIIPSVAISAVAGLIHLKLKTYLFYTFLGSVVRAFILGYLGATAGALYQTYADEIARAENAILLGAVIILFGFIFARLISKKKSMS